MIFFAGLVVILIWKASDPRTWTGLTARKDGDRAIAEPGRSVRAPGMAEEPLSPGTFRSALPDAPEPAEEASPIFPEGPLTVAPEVLAEVRDELLGVRGPELDAYYAVLKQTRAAPLRAQEGAARKVTYAELYNDLPAYRGQLVTLDGEVRRVTRLDDPNHSSELGPTYEAWLFLREAGPKYPICIRFLDLPAGMPVGDKILERVKVTGFVFKRYHYTTDVGINSAPMLLARKPRWFPRRPVQPGHEAGAIGLFATVTVMALAFGLIAWRSSLSHRPRREILPEEPAPSAAAFAELEMLEIPDLNTVVARLEAEAEERRRAEPPPPATG